IEPKKTLPAAGTLPCPISRRAKYWNESASRAQSGMSNSLVPPPAGARPRRHRRPPSRRVVLLIELRLLDHLLASVTDVALQGGRAKAPAASRRFVGVGNRNQRDGHGGGHDEIPAAVIGLVGRQGHVAQAAAAGPVDAVAQGLILERKAGQLVRRQNQRGAGKGKQEDTAKRFHR